MQKTKSVIYETTGRAREYCQLAINLYSGCAHGCLYCSSPLVLHQARLAFRDVVKPRVTPADIQISAAFKEGETRPVLLCFTTDPLQPIEAKLELTRTAIKILHGYDFTFSILTKAGALAQRDFDLYLPYDSFGTTLTFLNREKSLHWEPGAALPEERIANLMEAKKQGIPTWVSLEPVIEPMETIAVVEATHQWVDHYKVGKLNYHPEAAKIDWADFAKMAMATLRKHEKGFYIKRDLSSYLGMPGGYKEGKQLP